MEDKLQNSISTKTLCREYDWYSKTFPELVQSGCDDFFDKNFKLEFIGLSKNINFLLDNETCFVTKIQLDKDYEMFFRFTGKAINIILNRVLGQSKNKFNINKISDLEAKIITTFNDFLYERLKSVLSQPDATQLKRTNFDVIHLTFVLKENDDYRNLAGKFIITLPKVLVNPEEIPPAQNVFSEEDFPASLAEAKVFVGKTKFSIFDIKNLEAEDVVVFDDSNIHSVKLIMGENTLDVNLNANMDILIPDINNGGDTMGDSHQNLWDSIEVEMSAEFDSVKITLGELKNIENGLVVDLASLYDNNVTLKVEGKPIASGSLVIVNDKYGVKINNVIANGTSGSAYGGASPEAGSQNSDEEVSLEQATEDLAQGNPEPSGQTASEAGAGGSDEEFDYSDFELDDDNI